MSPSPLSPPPLLCYYHLSSLLGGQKLKCGVLFPHRGHRLPLTVCSSWAPGYELLNQGPPPPSLAKSCWWQINSQIGRVSCSGGKGSRQTHRAAMSFSVVAFESQSESVKQKMTRRAPQTDADHPHPSLHIHLGYMTQCIYLQPASAFIPVSAVPCSRWPITCKTARWTIFCSPLWPFLSTHVDS